MPKKCTKCGNAVSLEWIDSETGIKLREIDQCKDCFFGKYEYKPIIEQVVLRNEK